MKRIPDFLSASRIALCLPYKKAIIFVANKK